MAELNVICAEAVRRLLPDIVLADADGLIDREISPIATVTLPVILLLRIPLALIVAILIIATLVITTLVIAALIISTLAVTACAPRDVKRVGFRTVVRIVDLNHCRGAVAGFPHQLLAATPVHACKTEPLRIGRHGAGAVEPAPLRGLTLEVHQLGRSAADFQLGGTIHHHLNGAFPFAGVATSAHGGLPALGLLLPVVLRVQRRNRRSHSKHLE